VRPTPDAMRERVFAVLGERVCEARVLDLYAGTGAVGLEALSRGAQGAVFVEQHRAAARLLTTNRDALEVSAEVGRILVCPALAAVRRLARGGESFQLAWADPPFESWQDGLESLALAFETGVLEAAGTACLECPTQARVEPDGDLEVERDLGGGASRVVLLRRRR